jgi:hypothetical protein
MENYEPMLVKKEKSNRFSKFIVSISILIPFVYTVVAVYFAWHLRYIPAEVTIGVYGFFGTELLAVAWRTKEA